MKILIVRLGALGDTVFASVAISTIQQNLPEDTQIDWLGSPITHSLFKHDPRINNVYSIKFKKLPTLLNADKKQIISISKKAPYDLIINLENDAKFFSIVKQIHAKYKVGAPFTKGPDDSKQHAVESMLEVTKVGLAKLTKNNKSNYYPTTLVGSDYKALQNKFNLPERYIVLHPGNSHVGRAGSINYRAWPITHWQSLATSLCEKYHKTHSIILVGCPNEQAFIEQLEKDIDAKNILNLGGKTSVNELITLIEQAELLISTDTGPSHIASAVKTPVLAMLGPNDYRKTGPYSHADNQVEIISLGLECSPCLPDGSIKNCRSNICMINLKPEIVLNKVATYIKEINGN
ncbi:glycosyltransferase family 9 protein [Psychromonas sp. KJ10-10]|uniref:glycosyltransferase family 9 protein n=1 Tax=Psychromonas sp. KJ10-10 TaxID=3391823 RepID=UPI0039B5B9B7